MSTLELSDTLYTVTDFRQTTAALRTVFRRCLPFISADQTRPHLSGMRVQTADGLLQGLATDGHSGCVTEAPAPGFAPPKSSLLIPDRVLSTLTRILPTDGTVQLRWSTERLSVTTGRTTVYGKLTDATFPSLHQFKPKQPVATVTRVDLIEAIEGALALHKEGKTHFVLFETRDGAMKVSAGDQASAGAFEDSVVLKVHAPTPRFAANGLLMLAALRTLDHDRVYMEWGKLDPVYFWGEGVTEGDYRVIMPMRDE